MNELCSHLLTCRFTLNTGHYGNSPGRGDSQLVPCRAPHSVRRFSPRECARLMGFPNSYKLPDRREGQGEMAWYKEQYRMFGNAVCPPLIAALAGAVLARCKDISGYEKHKDWEEWGRQTAIRLSFAATLQTPSATIPSVCVPATFFSKKRKR